jgi:hypothetical protein
LFASNREPVLKSQPGKRKLSSTPNAAGGEYEIAAVLTAGLASGQATKISDEGRKAILDYQLTMPRANQLIAALESMTKYVVSLPDSADRVRRSMQMTPAEQMAQIEKDPGTADILKKNQLTARDYIVGVPALRMALLAASGMPQGSNIVASPANVAFAKANLAVLKPKMDAADGIGARR